MHQAPPPQNMAPQGPPGQDMASISRRLKMLEEAASNARKRMQLNEQNSIEQHKKQNQMITAFGQEINEMRNDIDDLKKTLQLIIKELQQCAKSQDVKVLQKYVDMWQPITFVTNKEVERIVRDQLRMHNSSQRANIPATHTPSIENALE